MEQMALQLAAASSSDPSLNNGASIFILDHPEEVVAFDNLLDLTDSEILKKGPDSIVLLSEASKDIYAVLRLSEIQSSILQANSPWYNSYNSHRNKKRAYKATTEQTKKYLDCMAPLGDIKHIPDAEEKLKRKDYHRCFLAVNNF